jgi:hypothetical protein
MDGSVRKRTFLGRWLLAFSGAFRVITVKNAVSACLLYAFLIFFLKRYTTVKALVCIPFFNFFKKVY